MVFLIKEMLRNASFNVKGRPLFISALISTSFIKPSGVKCSGDFII
jgi:hypothetical protein